MQFSQAFVTNGAIVYISSRDAKACESVAAALTVRGPGRAYALPEDLATDAGCRRLASRLAEQTSLLHVLVNNSGVAWGEPIESFSEQGWKKVMAVNVEAVFNTTRACLPLLDAGSSAESPARVINVGSIAGIKPQAFPTWSYDISKAAVHHLTLKMARTFADRRAAGGHSICVNAIAPGYVPSKMSKQLDRYQEQPGELEQSVPLRRLGCTADMAGAVLYLASPAGAWVTGIVLPVDGGYLSKL